MKTIFKLISFLIIGFLMSVIFGVVEFTYCKVMTRYNELKE